MTGAVSGLVVLDADGPAGRTSLKELHPPATTWLSQTGRPDGGWQLFFKHPEVRIGNRTGLRPGIDVRGDGGYVVIPPSLHRSQRRYAWLTSPEDLPLADLPDHLLALLQAPGQPATGAATGGDVIPEGQRNDRLFRTARGLVARGLSREAILAALLEENRTRCRPPLTDREIRALVEHAVTHPDRPEFRAEPVMVPHHQDLPPTGPENLRHFGSGGTWGKSELLPLAVGLGRYLTLDFPAVEPYVEGILSSDGGGWISGEEKLGKTLYALNEALGLALGEPVCGRFTVPHRRRVLLIEEEDSPRRTSTRLRAMLRGYGYDPDSPGVQTDLDAWFRLAVWTGFSFDEAAMLARLDAELAEFRPAVCYVDVLRKVTMRDLNKAQEAGALLASLDALRRKYAVAFRILHHYRKSQGFRVGRGSQEIGGSFVLGAWAENSLFFEPIGRKQGAVRVEIQTKDGAPSPAFRFVIESDGPPHAPTTIRLHAEDDTVDGADADDAVVQAIATLPKSEAVVVGKPGVSVQAIAAALKRSDKTVRRALKRLEATRRVLVTGKLSKQQVLYGASEQC